MSDQIKDLIAYLYQLLHYETSDPYPVKLDESLYKRVQKALDELKYSKDINQVHARYYNNLLEIYEKLVDTRIRKIIMNLLNGKELFKDRLTEEEYQVYVNIKNIISKHKARLLDFSSKITIEMLEDVPQYIDPNNITRGPFEKGQIIEIDREEAEWMIRDGKARIVEKS